MTRSTGPVRVPLRPTLGQAYRLTFGRLGGWLALIAVLQGVVVLIAVPGLHSLFGAALRTAHIASLSLDTVGRFFGTPAGVALFVLLVLLGLAALFVQATVFLLAAAAQQASGGALPGPGALLRALGARLRGLLRPSSLLLVPYAFLLAPLGGAAIGTVLTDWIMVPNFVSGELTKTTAGSIAYGAALLVLWYVALRLLLTIPFMAVSGLSAPAAMAASWRATGWVPWRIAVLVLGVVIPAALVAMLLGGIGLGVTALGERSELLGAGPDLAVGIAAGVWGALQVLMFFVTGLAIALQSQVFTAFVAASRSEAPDMAAEGAALPRALRRTLGVAIPVGAFGIAVLLAIQAFPHLDRLDDAETMVIAHRGAPQVAVENTIPALEAANAQGADLVEFDTIQTADGDWVVMHDFNLTRLAGDGRDTADLTLEELTSMTVTAGGHEARIPSLREFVRRAHELDQDLLIEIKPSGKETEDYLERFFAILDEEGVTESSLYHSLSADVVAGQQALRPELTVGYIVSVNVGGLPETPAQFVVVEEWSYTPALRDAAWDAGKGVLVWTVNEVPAMRSYLREPVDGIISDLPAVAGEERRMVAEDRSLTAKLWDAIDRLVAIG